MEREVTVPAGEVALAGTLAVPREAGGIVLFAHGTGSGRHSPRNRSVAAALRRDGLGTLLIDLLTEGEERVDARTGHLRFDIGLLARRVTAAAGWVRSEVPIPLGCFGASTGAAAALVAAADRPGDIDAVVSRGGRPDLAGDSLERVEAPTLLIVGSRDLEVLDLNRRALARLRGRKDLRIVEGATHLFEEPGALERVAALARDWFLRHLAT